jgi:3-dehydroquinate dehydratase/shikimate dehydrogenase
MICVSVATESRRMAMADMLTAARQADLLELRLDRFGRAPDVRDLLAAKRKPVVVACRRPADGGAWQGSEDERLALLRQCVIDGADYVEVELDVADQIRHFPGCKRVVSYTALTETPADISERYDEARAKRPDVVKLTTRARTPEEAWPLVQILARASVPTIVVGLGPAGVTLDVLGKKLGAPWAYAALGRGLESYPGEPTIDDLEAVYRYRSIDRATRLVGVTGLDDRARYSIAALNACFADLNLPTRCWPVAIGNLGLFRKIARAVKLAGLIVDDAHQGTIQGIATETDASASEAGAADVLQEHAGGWRAYQTAAAAGVAALESTLAARTPGGKLKAKFVAVVGTSGSACGVARAVQALGASVIIVGHKRDEAHRLAERLGCRYVLLEALYGTLHDVLVVCPSGDVAERRAGAPAVHPGYLRPGMAVLDLTASIAASPLLRAAEDRDCVTVPPRQLFAEVVARQFHLLAGVHASREVLTDALDRCAERDGLV